MPLVASSEQLLAKAFKWSIPKKKKYVETLQLERNPQLQSLQYGPLLTGLQIAAGDAVLRMKSHKQGHGC